MIMDRGKKSFRVDISRIINLFVMISQSADQNAR